MKEEEIRPEAIFNRYLELAAADAQKYFESSLRTPIACPACGSSGSPAFEKHGFSYEECPRCKTLYVSPRPAAEAFSRFYQEASSVAYWADTFYPVTAEARREKLWKPKARIVYDYLESVDYAKSTVVDIGGGYGIFAEEYQKISGQAVLIIEPNPPLARACRGRGLKVVEGFLADISTEELPAGPLTFTSFELFEHLHNPKRFMGHVYDLMRSGDKMVFTTLSGAGVDIRALWKDSKSVFPPHHLNFFNPVSTKPFLEQLGFVDVRITTPGKLDIDIMFKNLDKVKDRFWQVFLAQADEKQRNAFQQLVSEQGWSSHMMTVCTKP